MRFWKKENQISLHSPKEGKLFTIALWWQASRPKTWIAAISPVFLGIIPIHAVNVSLFFMTIFFALCIQIATNLTNDYYDALTGVDTTKRKGPIRVCHSGLLPPQRVKRIAFVFFVIAAAIGSYYQFHLGGWVIPIVIVSSILLGWAYTAGPFPLSRVGLSELAVFLYFGPVASLGTYYLQTGNFTFLPVLLGIGPGLVSCALLTVNNIRDIHEDNEAGKTTLIVRFGEKFGKITYILLMEIASFLPLIYYLMGFLSFPFALISCFSVIAAFLGIRLYRMAPSKEMNHMLAATAIFLWGYTFSFYLLWLE